ncbi:MAG: SAM-dependent methyltransferase [Sphingobacteriia bacterium]|nr:SAM-dependent methyltransferase [Sphingobacteriia bacterium]
MPLGTVYLIPTYLCDENIEPIPAYVVAAIKQCTVFFVEQEKTTRKYFKRLWKEMVIDDYEWITIHKAEQQVKQQFINQLKAGKNIGIVSEAGCPGIADPGQVLVEAAQNIGATVKPLTGPSSILLALMASGMNGQCFQFNGYLPIDPHERKKKIKELETESIKKNCSQLFIETPYRNNQVIKDIIDTCHPNTQLCIAVNLTAASENIQTKNIQSWKRNIPDIHKHPAIFIIHAAKA